MESSEAEDNAGLNETKQYLQDPEAEETREPEKPSSSRPATEPPTIPGDSGNPGESSPGIPPENNPSAKSTAVKGKGPKDERSGKAPALLPACYEQVRNRTEATFTELNAHLPSLLCNFVTPDQAGPILASIFTCMCNYSTELCRMAMAQTVAPVYTIPNTYRVQQSLWEGLCQIIPSIARTSGSELCSTQLVVPNNTLVEQSDATSGAGGSGDPGVKATGLENQPVTVSKSSARKEPVRGRHGAKLHSESLRPDPFGYAARSSRTCQLSTS